MTSRRAAWVFVGAVVLLMTGVAALTLRDLDVPGLYYDETFQAEAAAVFISGAEGPGEPPGSHAVPLLGRRFPVTTQSYMGALKSQLLIPPFALFGATPAVLRVTTVTWALTALLLMMLWARRTLGPGAAPVAGALLAADPTFLFVSRHDWGSFALGLLCRCAGLWLLTRGWQRRSPAGVFAGGLCLGLGIYNKADFVVFLAAAVPALLIAVPRLRSDLFGSRRRDLAAGLAGLALGAAPLLVGLGAMLRSAGVRAGSGTDAAEWAEKLGTMRAMFDGSYFQRLMLCGGAFPRLFEVEGAAHGWLLPVFALGVLVLAGAWWARTRRNDVEIFLLLTALLTMLGVLLLPGAVRIHHAMNVLPFPQLVVAAAAVRLWKMAGHARVVARPLTVAVLLLALGGDLSVTRRTWTTVRATGGRGFWTDASARLVDDLEREPDLTVVCLDWGFSLPIAFLSPGLRMEDPSWRMRDAASWTIHGDSGRIYLVWADEFGLLPYGRALLGALGELPSGVARVRSYDDRSGTPAFFTVRFRGAHRLVWDGALRVVGE